MSVGLDGIPDGSYCSKGLHSDGNKIGKTTCMGSSREDGLGTYVLILNPEQYDVQTI